MLRSSELFTKPTFEGTAYLSIWNAEGLGWGLGLFAVGEDGEGGEAEGKGGEGDEAGPLVGDGGAAQV